MAKFRPLFTTLALLALSASSAWAQRRVTGRVTAEGSAEPLGAASVQVLGTTIGGYTTEDGRFSLTVPDGAQQIRVRRIGYRQRVVPIPAAQTELTVALERDVLQLETQVVTGTATTIARANAANDVAQVTGEELNRAPTPTVENALQGKIAGANVVTNSGAPGGGAQFRIRGVTSILGNTDPLLVVDGVIISNDAIQPGTNAVLGASAGSDASTQDNGVNRLADLNPADIENIEVLKGASASNIYGSRASNGVIIITTRRGSAGRPQLNLTQRVGTFDLANKLGSRRFSLEEAYELGGDVGLDSADVRENYQRCNGYCDYEEQLYGRNSLAYETNLSLRGGNGGTTYFVSGLLKQDGGIAPNSYYRKQSLRANINQSIGSRFTVQVNTNLVHSLVERSLSNNDNVNVTPYFVLPSTPSFFDLRARDGVYPENPFTSSNPLQTLNSVRTPEEVFRLLGSATANYTVFSNDRQNLQLRLNGGIDQFSQSNNVISPRELQYESADGLPGTLTFQNGDNVYGNGGVSFTHAYTAPFATFTTSGGAQREYRSQAVSNIVSRDVLTGQGNIELGSARESFDFRQKQYDDAFFAQEEMLAFDERLLLTAAVRAQRSSVNGDENKYYTFPKFAASYRLPALLPEVNEFKLRLAYGQAGNPPLISAQFTPLITGVYGGQTGTQFGARRGNPNIKPERQAEIEGGVDITLFNSRASLNVTGYQRNITDLLLRPAAAPSRGITQFDINGGELRNRGIEVQLGATPFQTRNANLISRVTFARNVGKVLALPAELGRVQCLDSTRRALETVSTRCPVGFTSGAFGFFYGQGRIEVGASPTQIVGQDTIPGITGCSIDTPSACRRYQRRFGDTEPKFTFGFSNEINFRGVRLYGLVDWRHDFQVVNLTRSVYNDLNTDPDTAAVNRRNDLSTLGVSPYIEDGSFVKLRELTLSYELPATLSGRVFGGRARSARLELSGRNLRTWTDYTGLDPEVSNFGNTNTVRNQDLAPFPPTRSYFFSIDLGF